MVVKQSILGLNEALVYGLVIWGLQPLTKAWNKKRHSKIRPRSRHVKKLVMGTFIWSTLEVPVFISCTFIDPPTWGHLKEMRDQNSMEARAINFCVHTSCETSQTTLQHPSSFNGAYWMCDYLWNLERNVNRSACDPLMWFWCGNACCWEEKGEPDFNCCQLHPPKKNSITLYIWPGLAWPWPPFLLHWH